MKEEALQCFTGVVSGVGHNRIRVSIPNNPAFQQCSITANTVFMGAAVDKPTYAALAQKPGLSVNVWLREGSKVAAFASPNWQ